MLREDEEKGLSYEVWDDCSGCFSNEDMGGKMLCDFLGDAAGAK